MSSDSDSADAQEDEALQHPLASSSSGQPQRSSNAMEEQLASLIERMRELELERSLQVTKPAPILGQARRTDPSQLIRKVKQDPTFIGTALTKGRKLFDKPDAIQSFAPEKDKETMAALKGILMDLMRVIPSIGAMTDTLEELLLDRQQATVEVPLRDALALLDTARAVTTLLNLNSQAIRLKLWKSTVTAVAPSIRPAAAEALIAKYWARDELSLLIAAATKAETATSAVEANRNIAKLLSPKSPSTTLPTHTPKRIDKRNMDPKKPADKAAQPGTKAAAANE